jgi:murein L,D-transpeptidase YafK
MSLLAIILSLVFSVTSFAAAQDLPGHVDQIIVYKQQREMILLAQGHEIKRYRIALGEQPVGPKQKQGDHRTPEGSYVLDSRNPHSQYYKAFHISYPNESDRERARKLGVSPGGLIMLHGTPKEFAPPNEGDPPSDWTDGCIAVTNTEMDELWTTLRVGTPIEIRP